MRIAAADDRLVGVKATAEHGRLKLFSLRDELSHAHEAKRVVPSAGGTACGKDLSTAGARAPDCNDDTEATLGRHAW